MHTILAPKGGCGKTYVASLIAQALQERGEPVVCFDTDRENASLRDIAALKAEPVRLFRPNSDEIDIHAMDGMTERMLREDAHFVLDNGATSFAPLSRYLVRDSAEHSRPHPCRCGDQRVPARQGAREARSPGAGAGRSRHRRLDAGGRRRQERSRGAADRRRVD